MKQDAPRAIESTVDVRLTPGVWKMAAELASIRGLSLSGLLYGLLKRQHERDVLRDSTPKPVPPIYVALVMEVERRRIARGISMAQMSELMGTAERSYSKMLYPDAGDSSRLVRWETLQLAVDVVFADGFRLKMELRTNGDGVHTTEGARRRIKQEAATWNRPLRKQLMRELGSRGGLAKASRMSPEDRRLLGASLAHARRMKACSTPHEGEAVATNP